MANVNIVITIAIAHDPNHMPDSLPVTKLLLAVPMWVFSILAPQHSRRPFVYPAPEHHRRIGRGVNRATWTRPSQLRDTAGLDADPTASKQAVLVLPVSDDSSG